MKLAVIPARGGSKRIPRKNIKLFLGKPIIQYSIEAALACKCVDRVIVSTDDEEIAVIARSCGAEVPFMRPQDISNDHASTMSVIQHALRWADSQGKVEAICCLYATAPFSGADDLQQAYDLFCGENAAFVFSVTAYPFPIQRAIKLENGRVSMFQPEYMSTRSQDLVPAYHDAGQFYWCRPDAVHKHAEIFAPHSAAYLMDHSRVVDIDTAEDWALAEKLFQLSQ